MCNCLEASIKTFPNGYTNYNCGMPDQRQSERNTSLTNWLFLNPPIACSVLAEFVGPKEVPVCFSHIVRSIFLLRDENILFDILTWCLHLLSQDHRPWFLRKFCNRNMFLSGPRSTTQNLSINYAVEITSIAEISVAWIKKQAVMMALSLEMFAAF